METGELRPVPGLPENPKIENLSWAPGGSKMAFTITRPDGLELWWLALDTGEARPLTAAVVNDTLSSLPYTWLPNAEAILWKRVLPQKGERPEPAAVPEGPLVQDNAHAGQAAVRTYQDLMQSPHDEECFEYFGQAQLMLSRLDGSEERALPIQGLISGFQTSPDGQWLLVQRIRQPYAYSVPYNRFPFDVELFDIKGRPQRLVAQVPSSEQVPDVFDAVRTGPRDFSWRADMPATLVWVEALDGGDPRSAAAQRDAVFQWAAPFEAAPQEIARTEFRYEGILWHSGDLAVLREGWWKDRLQVATQFSPDRPEARRELLRFSSDDEYNHPGSFLLHANAYGRYVLQVSDDGRGLFLAGKGATPEGNRPFLRKFDRESLSAETLWRCAENRYEEVASFEAATGLLLVRRESPDTPPNYFLRYFPQGEERQLTHFEHPFPLFTAVKKELVHYKRSDGLPLSGTLYLPPGYDPAQHGPLPTLLWAYPKEFRKAAHAGQVTDSPFRFTWVHSHSPVLWVMRGYAVLDDPAMPIIGEEGTEPNDTFTEQLVDGAESAVSYLVAQGIADPGRVAIGGHSYGAFMTAHLLSHSKAFAAGIARSGAYNRTLTPFGFQHEDRNFWEAPEAYHRMSPFAFAHQMKTPLLLVHGQDDRNPGTHTMQTERYYAALKGLGAPVRMVLLPHEGHSYRARESVFHMVWETDHWLEKHLGQAPYEVPEEGSLALLALGFRGLAAWREKKI